MRSPKVPAERRYPPGSRKLARATERYARHTRRYQRFQDQVAGAPEGTPARGERL